MKLRLNFQDKPRLLSDTPVADDDEESAGEMTGIFQGVLCLRLSGKTVQSLPFSLPIVHFVSYLVPYL